MLQALTKTLTTLCLLLCLSAVSAAETLRLEALGEDIHAIVGPLTNRSAQNLGNNATFGFVVTRAGVVLIDSGGTYMGAVAIEKQIRKVTDKPVVVVINTGGQDHRWLGNGYFKARGARIISSKAGVEDQRARLQEHMTRLGNLMGAAELKGTEPVYADERFEKEHILDVGGVRFELRHAGQAHTPGDLFVWLPKSGVMFSGDIVYTERMLRVGSHSNSRSWITAFEAMAAYKPRVVVPGHGAPTTLARAEADTYDYLTFLRKTIGSFMEDGGDITQTGSLDQSAFKRLFNYDTLKGRNAQQVFQEMEWE